MVETRIYTDLYLSSNNITDVNKISFEDNANNCINDSGPTLYVQGDSAMFLQLKNDYGVIYVKDCQSFAPASTLSNIMLGNILSKWKRLYLGADGIYFDDGTIQTTAGGLGDHTHNGAGDGGDTLAPKYLYMSTNSTARFRLPVGNNMY